VANRACGRVNRVIEDSKAGLRIGVYANAFPPQSKDATANTGLSEIRADLAPENYLAFAKAPSTNDTNYCWPGTRCPLGESAPITRLRSEPDGGVCSTDALISPTLDDLEEKAFCESTGNQLKVFALDSLLGGLGGCLFAPGIEYFRAVMESGSVSGAAALLNVSQPNVSRMIKYTEMRLGLTLFERRKGRLQPTPEATS